MSEYINKKTVLQDMGERYDCYNPEIEADRNIRKGLVFAKMIIDKQSIANVQEIKHGKWEYDSGDVGYTNYLCSECKNFLTFYEGIDLYPYCPYCGAKMDGKEEK